MTGVTFDVHSLRRLSGRFYEVHFLACPAQEREFRHHSSHLIREPMTLAVEVGEVTTLTTILPWLVSSLLHGQIVDHSTFRIS